MCISETTDHIMKMVQKMVVSPPLITNISRTNHIMKRVQKFYFDWICHLLLWYLSSCLLLSSRCASMAFYTCFLRIYHYLMSSFKANPKVQQTKSFFRMSPKNSHFIHLIINSHQSVSHSLTHPSKYSKCTLRNFLWIHTSVVSGLNVPSFQVILFTQTQIHILSAINFNLLQLLTMGVIKNVFMSAWPFRMEMTDRSDCGCGYGDSH